MSNRHAVITSSPERNLLGRRSCSGEQAACYDLLLKGGHVIDPANGINDPMDVAVTGDRIAFVGKDVPTERAEKVVNVEGLYVTPGLIDLHIHVTPPLDHYICADVIPLRTGVTTIVDAGSTGCTNFEQFKVEVIDVARVRVLALLNIAACGMIRREQDSAEWDILAAADMIDRYADTIVGVKSAHYRGPDFGPVDRAVHVGRETETPVMVDFWAKATATYEDLLLRHLRPGDIHTHFYARQFPLLNENGQVQDYVWEARERGVVFDVGHGAGSFWFRIAVPAVDQSFVPDSISTDLHGHSVLLPDATMPGVMSKFLNMGMPLDEVIMRSTVTPARQIQRQELGTLNPGACADVAVFELREGNFGFVDSGRARMRGHHRLECQMTIRAGEVIWDPNGLSWPDWQTAADYDYIGAAPLPRHDWPI
jgi:dihydroorotase